MLEGVRVSESGRHETTKRANMEIGHTISVINTQLIQWFRLVQSILSSLTITSKRRSET
jgi:hypothetical protein